MGGIQSGPFITAIIALLGVFITVWRQMAESGRQHMIDRHQQESEQIRRFDERFQTPCNLVPQSLPSPTECPGS